MKAAGHTYSFTNSQNLAQGSFSLGPGAHRCVGGGYKLIFQKSSKFTVQRLGGIRTQLYAGIASVVHSSLLWIFLARMSVICSSPGRVESHSSICLSILSLSARSPERML